MHTLQEQLISWRRDFHQHPEQGYMEIRTASIIASTLESLGFNLQIGKEVMDKESMMGVPSDRELQVHVDWAVANGAIEKYVPNLVDGFTGIVATLYTERPGPVIAFRVDMDALPIDEANDDKHLPYKEGFRSIHDGSMHACGHDAHMAIGLGLATKIAEAKDALCGTIKLIFQPAEEGVRGAKSMVAAGVVDDVDYFIASHIGTGIPLHHFVAANNNFLATTKLNVRFKGISAHAGVEPEVGKNALLAAATATLNLHAISRHSAGASRVNVGELHGGSGRNIVANNAQMLIETRGETAEINEYVKAEAIRMIEGAAHMYGVDFEIDTVGEAINSTCSSGLAEQLFAIAQSHSFMKDVQLRTPNDGAGSEDATYFIDAVQKRGGEATYCVFGTDLAAGHHHERFDINEKTLLPAVEILFQYITEQSGA